MAVAAARRRLLYRPFTPKNLHPVLWLDASRIISIDPVAALCTAANSESLSVADNTALSMGAGATMAMHCFVNLTTTPGAGAQFHIAGKWHSVTTSLQEYALVVDNTSGTIRFKFQVRDTGDTVTTTVTATTFGTPSTATWYSLWCYYDGAALGISVNDGVVDTAAYSGDILDSTSQFRIGSTADGASFLDGSVQLLDVWKNTVPTAAQVTALRNSGNGVFFSALPASIQVGQVERWNLSEVSGTRAGSIGGYTLSDNNTVTAAASVGTPGLSDGGVVSTWPDVSGARRNATQATFANKPAHVLQGINSRAVVHYSTNTQDLATASALWFPNRGGLLVIVFSNRATQAAKSLIVRTYDGNNPDFAALTYPNVNGDKWFDGISSFQLGGADTAGNTYITSYVQIASTAMQVWRNGELLGTASTADQQYVANPLRVSPATVCSVYVATVLYSDRVPSVSSLMRLHRYLNKRYAAY